MIITDKLVIGNRLYKIRKERNLTQFEAAELAGISDRAFADIERGSKNMRVESLCKICAALNITPDVLLVDDNKETKLAEAEILTRFKESNPRDKEVLCNLIATYLNTVHKI